MSADNTFENMVKSYYVENINRKIDNIIGDNLYVNCQQSMLINTYESPCCGVNQKCLHQNTQ